MNMKINISEKLAEALDDIVVFDWDIEEDREIIEDALYTINKLWQDEGFERDAHKYE